VRPRKDRRRFDLISDALPFWDFFVPTRRFVGAFIAGCKRFEAKVHSDNELQQRVFFHAKNLLVAID
jgi:hypothetical protein